MVVLLVLLSTVFATGADYVNADCGAYSASAIADFGTSCAYPQCMGAAGRYEEAAQCYAVQGNTGLANEYYAKAADYYLKGKDYLASTGDYPLRAQSYEHAGDMEAMLGQVSLASSYYDSAIAEYLNINQYSNADAVRAKKLSVLTQSQAATGFSISAGNLAIGAIVLVAVIGLFLYMRRPQEEERPLPEPVMPMPIERAEEPMSPKQSAKDKMRERIRKKYGLA